MAKLEADIVVIAAGASGLAACVAAAEKGAKVIALEKASVTGGTGNMGMGPFGLESPIQRLKQMGPTKEQAFKEMMHYTHYQVDAKLVSTYFDKATTTIEWLQNMGVEFFDALPYFPGGWPTWHIIAPGGEGCARNLYRILTEKAKEKGVEILLQTPVKKIIKQGGKVTGVIAEDRNGEKIEVACKAVIVATGGFGDNPQLIKKFTGFEWGVNMQSFRIPGLAGDGHRMAWEVGAVQTEMKMEMIFLPPGGDDKENINPVDPELMEAFRQPNYLCNIQGERFMDEAMLPNSTFTGNAIAFQKGKCAFNIFDESIRKKMEEGYEEVHFVFPFMKLEKFDDLIKKSKDAGYKYVYVADSLEDLAAQTGINPAGLKAGVEEYNAFCEKGYDPVFHKRHKSLNSLKGPKYYAMKFLPGAYGSLGGIKVNYKMEVQDKEWNAIPGLYGAGTDANTLYGDSYPFILPGNTMGWALNSGRMAGESAVDYIKSIA
jgi:fumarate reductase flavoprotein subunit